MVKDRSARISGAGSDEESLRCPTVGEKLWRDAVKKVLLEKVLCSCSMPRLHTVKLELRCRCSVHWRSRDELKCTTK